ncbi:hypothetical protein AOLI_G00163730 [Acnodon oligacanthus]
MSGLYNKQANSSSLMSRYAKPHAILMGCFRVGVILRFRHGDVLSLPGSEARGRRRDVHAETWNRGFQNGCSLETGDLGSSLRTVEQCDLKPRSSRCRGAKANTRICLSPKPLTETGRKD